MVPSLKSLVRGQSITASIRKRTGKNRSGDSLGIRQRIPLRRNRSKVQLGSSGQVHGNIKLGNLIFHPLDITAAIVSRIGITRLHCRQELVAFSLLVVDKHGTAGIAGTQCRRQRIRLTCANTITEARVTPHRIISGLSIRPVVPDFHNITYVINISTTIGIVGFIVLGIHAL